MPIEERIEKLKLVLKDLFQFENNDLDFGIYRIINIKKKEIGEFIDKELFDIIKEKIKTVEDNTELQKNIEILKKEIETSFGCDIQEAKKKYTETPKMKEYCDKEKELQKAEKETDIEEEIYDDIINFFSRYYDRGDFISKRRYSKDPKYAIPYNGAEVYLHWANNDQYYIKTTEIFKNYSFKTGAIKVNFEIVSEEVDVEKNNIKDPEDKFFIFHDADYDSHGKIVRIGFGYRGLTDEEEKTIEELTDRKRIDKDEINTYNLQKIQEKIGIYGLSDLQKNHIKLDGEKSDKNELAWHLNKYTTKNTTDYFIHKDLKKFLKQELDFYIKNEILHLDDIDTKENLDINLKRVKAFKEISLKIIEFLAQIEEFQKKLWEKKKFVLTTDYCITLDYIDEKYYPQILDNEKQIEEWKNLFSFDIQKEIVKCKGKITSHNKNNKEKMIEILKENKTLVIDTKFYDIDFKYQILNEIDDLDKKTTGILIKSENFQALNLLCEKYKGKINCIHIDPPYNTFSSAFPYKNNYQHSSWLSMMENRINKSINLLTEDGSLLCHIDENEYERLYNLFQSMEFPYLSTVIWDKKNPMMGGKGIAIQHEYIIWSSRFNGQFYSKAENIKEILKVAETLIKKHNGVNDKSREEYREYINSNKKLSGGEQQYHYLEDDGRVFRNVAMTWPNPMKPPKEFFIPLIHPVTKKPCPVPSRGWSRTPEKMKELLERNEIVFGIDETVQPLKKIYLTKDSRRPISSVIYNARKGKNDIEKLGLEFDYCHPVSLYEEIINGTILNNSAVIIDFFAGSGTTGHGVLNLNKENQGDTKFILVEMEKYFDTVLKPRILKVIYSNNWDEGKPKDNNGSKKQIIKYQSLEQYEDSLNNINFKEAPMLAKESKDYRIKYMLEFETRENSVFLNLDALNNPFDYKLKIINDNEISECNIDLIETFNYIYGIHVKSYKKKSDNSMNYVIVKGNHNEKDVIVIWRNINKNYFDAKRDKEFIKKEILTEEFDEIFVNGNSLIEDAKSIDEIFKKNLFKV